MEGPGCAIVKVFARPFARHLDLVSWELVHETGPEFGARRALLVRRPDVTREQYRRVADASIRRLPSQLERRIHAAEEAVIRLAVHNTEPHAVEFARDPQGPLALQGERMIDRQRVGRVG